MKIHFFQSFNRFSSMLTNWGKTLIRSPNIVYYLREEQLRGVTTEPILSQNATLTLRTNYFYKYFWPWKPQSYYCFCVHMVIFAVCWDDLCKDKLWNCGLFVAQKNHKLFDFYLVIILDQDCVWQLNFWQHNFYMFYRYLPTIMFKIKQSLKIATQKDIFLLVIVSSFVQRI